MNIKTNLQAASIRTIYDYLDRDFDENLPRVIDLLERFSGGDAYQSKLEGVRAALSDRNNNWYRLARSLWDDIDPAVRRTTFENFVINANLLWQPRREAAMKQYGCNVPWTLLIDPTSACNLHCTGCWAAEYGNRLNLTLEELDSIIGQAKELGIHMFLFSGGEPLVRRADILTLCRRHPDCEFSAFTNGTLIDEDFADQMLAVKNFVPAISVEGFEADTDFRRGEGTYARVTRAMQLLRDRKLPFGVSCCYTSKNVETIGSEAYFDWMIEQGAKFCWFFTFMPVGAGAPTDLMVTAEQRKFMYDRVRAFRKTKALFTIDFWNDGEYVGGCIAGGRNYLHINANGDVEPCAFIHYSNVNIREHTLVDALRSPLFQAYREGQPFSDNLLRPCPLLDNPGRLAEMVDRSGAHSTDLQHVEDPHALCEKCRPAAERWKPVADELWSCSHGCADCSRKED